MDITTTATPGIPPPKEGLVFGQNFTNHILILDWTAENGWLKPRIVPYQHLSVDPAASVLQYGVQAFEGMKAFKDKSGQARLFRPELNLHRLNKSAAKMALPAVPTQDLVEYLRHYTSLEKNFIPMGRGYSLHLRPNIIGTYANLKVGRPKTAMLYVIASPVGSHYASESTPLSLQTNNSPVQELSLSAMAQAMLTGQPGRPQSLNVTEKLNPATGKPEDYILDVLMMNVFVIIETQSGFKEIATPQLDGVIMGGIIRECVLDLARERLVPEGWTVSERDISIQELDEASAHGRLLEVFGANTATTITPIRTIRHQGREVECEATRPVVTSTIGSKMKAWLEDIQYGDEPDNAWSCLCN